MPPPRGTPNMLEGPGDYDVTSVVHSDTYPEINPTKADFSGKAVFVTGGTRGIGKAIVLRYVMAGASYIAASARSNLSQLGKDIEAAALSANRSPPKYLPVYLEATDPKSIEQAATTIEKEFGRLDILVNNAGVFGKLNPIADSDPTVWWEVMDINVRGTYLVSRQFLPLLQKTGDAYIVNVSSVGGHLVLPNASSYMLSKMAVVRMSELLNREYADKGVLVFSIHPGNCLTDMAATSGNVNSDSKHIFVDAPDLCGDTIAFLTSKTRTWIGGRYINVTWDMPELMKKEQEIVKGDKLRVKLDF